MAGSNQAVNLGGMLNQIAGTIGSGYTINGKNAGAAIGDTFANLARPEVDPNDPASLEKMAKWASRNGRANEAAQYNAAYLQSTKEQAALEGAKEMAGMAVGANKSARNVDLPGFDTKLNAMKERQGQARTAAEFDAMGQQIAKVEQQRAQVAEGHYKKQAGQVSGLEDWLDKNAGNEQIPADVLEKAAATRQRLLDDNRVADAYRANQIQDAQAALQTSAAREAQRREFVNAGYENAKKAGGDTWEQFQQQADNLGAGHLVQEKDAASVRQQATETALHQTLKSIADGEQDLQLANQTTNLDTLSSKIPVTVEQTAEIEAIKDVAARLDTQESGEKSPAHRAERRELAVRIRDMETELNSIYSAQLEAAAADRSAARESVTRMRENRAKISQSIPQARVDEEALRLWMEANGVKPEQLGTDPWFSGDYREMDDVQARASAEFGEQARSAIVAREAAPITALEQQQLEVLGGDPFLAELKRLRTKNGKGTAGAEGQ